MELTAQIRHEQSLRQGESGDLEPWADSSMPHLTVSRADATAHELASAMAGAYGQDSTVADAAKAEWLRRYPAPFDSKKIKPWAVIADKAARSKRGAPSEKRERMENPEIGSFVTYTSRGERRQRVRQGVVCQGTTRGWLIEDTDGRRHYTRRVAAVVPDRGLFEWGMELANRIRARRGMSLIAVLVALVFAFGDAHAAEKSPADRPPAKPTSCSSACKTCADPGECSNPGGRCRHICDPVACARCQAGK